MLIILCLELAYRVFKRLIYYSYFTTDSSSNSAAERVLIFCVYIPVHMFMRLDQCYHGNC